MYQIQVKETVYKKGSNPENEDRLVIHPEEHIYAVIDGATGLGGLPGSIAAEIVAQTLIDSKSANDLVARIKLANLRLKEKNLQEAKKTSFEEIPKNQRSVCSLAAVRIHPEGKLEYVHTGDCMLFVKYQDGSIFSVTFDLVDLIHPRTSQLIREEWEKRLHPEETPNDWEEEKREKALREIREFVRPLIREKRNRVNTPLGYSILDGSEEAISYLSYGVLPLCNVKQLLLLTDGLQLPLKSWEETAQFAFTFGLRALEEEVERFSMNDPACYIAPRMKKMDDQTGLVLEITFFGGDAC